MLRCTWFMRRFGSEAMSAGQWVSCSISFELKANVRMLACVPMHSVCTVHVCL